MSELYELGVSKSKNGWDVSIPQIGIDFPVSRIDDAEAIAVAMISRVQNRAKEDVKTKLVFQIPSDLQGLHEEYGNLRSTRKKIDERLKEIEPVYLKALIKLGWRNDHICKAAGISPAKLSQFKAKKRKPAKRKTTVGGVTPPRGVTPPLPGERTVGSNQ